MEQVTHVNITADDLARLQKLFYQVESRQSLLVRILSNKNTIENADELYHQVLDEVEQILPQYDICKFEMEQKYKPTDHEYKYWVANFDKSQMDFYY